VAAVRHVGDTVAALSSRGHPGYDAAMLAVLSPAKTLDLTTPVPDVAATDRLGLALASAITEQLDAIRTHGLQLNLSGELGAGKTALVRAILRGLARTQEWLHAAEDGAVAATILPFFPRMDPVMLARCVGRYRPLEIWSRTPEFPPEPWERLEQAMFTAGAIRRKLGHAHCVDNSLL